MKKIIALVLATAFLTSCGATTEKREDNLIPNDGKELTHPYPPEDI